MSKDSMLFVGVDLGDKFSHVTVLDQEGELVEEVRLPTTRAAFERKFSVLPRSRVAMEVGTHSRWASQLLEEPGHEVLVANARKLRAIYDNPRKDDRVDAEMLARLARLDPKLLSPIHHRSPEAQADLTVIRSRDALVRSRTLLIDHARSTVKASGGRLPSCSADSFHRQVRDAVPEPLRPALLPVIDIIASLTEQIRAYDWKVEELSKERYPETQLLRDIGGVGPLTSLAYVLTLENPGRFRTSSRCPSGRAGRSVRLSGWSPAEISRGIRTRSGTSLRPVTSCCGCCWWGRVTTSWGRLGRTATCAAGA